MTSRISSAFVQSRQSEMPQQKKRSASTKEAKKADGLAQAVAQEDHHMSSGSEQEDEATLRQFDLESKFGPVTGITRLQRWERAETLKLSPPEHIKDIIMKRGKTSAFNQHLFSEGKI